MPDYLYISIRFRNQFLLIKINITKLNNKTNLKTDKRRSTKKGQTKVNKQNEDETKSACFSSSFFKGFIISKKDE